MLGENSFIWPVWLKVAHRVSGFGSACQRVASEVIFYASLPLSLWCCPASVKVHGFGAGMTPRSEGIFLWALSILPSLHDRNSGTLSFCTSIKSFHACRKEMIFFFLPWLLHKGGLETKGALGCCRPGLRHTAEIESINMRAFRPLYNLPKNATHS